ncbi:uncharacterized protein LOC134220429 [Armigeres subalbatus]|uniref:uncharacterized protein LOC134220429 n=1 Tax=Armigeres subalbatus TaxID=124917 RepID=UPI002ED110A3
MDVNQTDDGKCFLVALIHRGIDFLTTLSKMVTESKLPLKQQIDLINSLYRFIETWEIELPGAVPTEQERNKEKHVYQSEIVHATELKQKNNSTFVSEEKVSHSKTVTTFTPEFELPPVSLDHYKPDLIGICVITYVHDVEAMFYMIDQSVTGISFAYISQTLQNIDVDLEDFPTSLAHVFGVRIDGFIFRAVRNKQVGKVDQTWIKLLDTGEQLAFDNTSMRLYELPPFYAKLPPFAIKCFLSNDQNQSREVQRQYLAAHLYHRLEYKVLEVTGSSMAVALNSNVSLENPVNIKKTENEEVRYKISSKTLTQAQLDELYEEPLNTTNVMKAVMGYAPRDDQRICPFYDPTIQGCFKGSRCRLEHTTKLADGWTRDKSLYKIQIRAALETPAIGTEMMVVPTYIVNVDEFYAHIPRLDLSESLIKLQNVLNEKKSVENFKMLNHEPYFRELVLAKYPEDNLWYRARVLEFYNPESISVFYVDYGNTEMVSLKELRCWDDQFDYLPFQAIHCRIANVQPRREQHIEAIRQLYNDIMNKTIKIQVLDNLTPWEVLVFDDEDNDVGGFLVLTKLASPRVPLVVEKREANLIPG